MWLFLLLFWPFFLHYIQLLRYDILTNYNEVFCGDFQQIHYHSACTFSSRWKFKIRSLKETITKEVVMVATYTTPVVIFCWVWYGRFILWQGYTFSFITPKIIYYFPDVTTTQYTEPILGLPPANDWLGASLESALSISNTYMNLANC